MSLTAECRNYRTPWEQSCIDIFFPRLSEDAKPAVLALTFRSDSLQPIPPYFEDLHLVTRSANAKENGEVLECVVSAPEVKVARDDLWTDHLAPPEREIRRNLAFIHIVADHCTIDSAV